MIKKEEKAKENVEETRKWKERSKLGRSCCVILRVPGEREPKEREGKETIEYTSKVRDSPR